MAKIGIQVHPLNEAGPELKKFREVFAKTIRSMASPQGGIVIPNARIPSDRVQVMIVAANPEDVIRAFDASPKTNPIRYSNEYTRLTIRLIASLTVIQMQDKLRDAAFEVAPLSDTTIELKGHSTPFRDHEVYIENIKLHNEGGSYLAGVSDVKVTGRSSMGIMRTVDVAEYAQVLEYGNPNHRIPGSDEPHPIPPRPHWGPFFTVELPDLLVKRYIQSEFIKIWKGQIITEG